MAAKTPVSWPAKPRISACGHFFGRLYIEMSHCFEKMKGDRIVFEHNRMVEHMLNFSVNGRFRLIVYLPKQATPIE